MPSFLCSRSKVTPAQRGHGLRPAALPHRKPVRLQRLQQALAKARRAAGQPVAKSDGDGLTFTMSARQAAAKGGTWVLRYRLPGMKSQKEIKVGSYPDLSLANARKEAAKLRVRVEQGEDVAREKQKEKRERATAWTVRHLADDYIEKIKGRLAPSTVEQRQQQIRDLLAEFAMLATPADPFDPMEKAIARFGHEWLKGTEHVQDGREPEFEYPLSSDILAMTRVFASGQPHMYQLATKGAPEAVADLCHLDEVRRRFNIWKMNGVARVKLYKGNVIVVGRDSKTDSLFDPTIATFDEDGGAYNHADAAGFIRLNALRLRIAAKLHASR
mgnify:CR=1 FL=1